MRLSSSALLGSPVLPRRRIPHHELAEQQRGTPCRCRGAENQHASGGGRARRFVSGGTELTSINLKEVECPPSPLQRALSTTTEL